MADQTIFDLLEVATVVSGDFIPVWKTAAGLTRKVSVENLTDAAVASILGNAQTFVALQTFSAGINLGNENLTVYNQGTWTPVVTGSTGNPTVAYTSQSGTYTQIGNIVFYAFSIVINTTSGGSGDLRVSMPIAVVTGAQGAALTSGVDLPNTPVSMAFTPVAGQSFGKFTIVQDNGAIADVPVSGIAAGDSLWGSGFYFV